METPLIDMAISPDIESLHGLCVTMRIPGILGVVFLAFKVIYAGPHWSREGNLTTQDFDPTTN